MWKVSISNQSKNLLWEAKFASQELAQSWLNSQIGKPHRLPEREVQTFDENGQPILDWQGNPVMAILPAEFTSEIKDLSLDADYQYQKMVESRRLEYPSVYECIEALMEEAEGNPEKLMLVMMKRIEVKEKYPKGK